MLPFLGESIEYAQAIAIPLLRRLPVQPLEEGPADAFEIVAARDRHEVLEADSLPAGLDSSLVVTCPRAREARFEQVMIGKRRETRCQLSLGASADLRDGGAEVV